MQIDEFIEAVFTPSIPENSRDQSISGHGEMAFHDSISRAD